MAIALSLLDLISHPNNSKDFLYIANGFNYGLSAAATT